MKVKQRKGISGPRKDRPTKGKSVKFKAKQKTKKRKQYSGKKVMKTRDRASKYDDGNHKKSKHNAETPGSKIIMKGRTGKKVY